MSAAPRTPCSAARPGQDYCTNGFTQTGPCQGTLGVPHCLDEKFCGRAYDSTGGKPRRPDEQAVQPTSESTK